MMDQRDRDVVSTVGMVLALFALGAIVSHCVGCGPRQPTAAQVAAEAAYGAALLQCVDQAKTLAESKACRARVDAEWGVVQTPSKDGGR